MPRTRQLPPVAAALRNPQLRRVLIGYLASVLSEWALWLALIVYAYERSGQTVAGFVTVSLFVPGAIMAPFAGVAADGPRPNRVLALVYATQAVSLTVAACFAFVHGPLLTVIVPAALALALVSFLRPCLSVVVPGLVKSVDELTAANVLTGYCANASVLVGPLIASGLIALDGAPIVLAVTAGLTLVGFLVTLPLIRLDPGPAAQLTPLREGSRLGALINGLRALSQRKGALPLLCMLGGQYVLIGSLDLLYVVLATETFGLDASGPGLLGAAFGVGAVIGSATSTVLVARQRLAPLLMLSMFGICAALAVMAGFPNLAVAIAMLPVIGLSRAVLDLTGRMLMQRAAPQDALASIFATIESLSLIASALGSIIAQVVIALAGVRAAVGAVAAVLGTVLLLSAKRLVQIDASADAPVVAIRLLRRIPMFAPLPGPAMEGVARAAQALHVAAGEAIIREGDTGDSYFAIVDGEVEVTMEGRHVRVMTRGQGFGEIALLADVPRTATVVAHTDAALLEIERPAFLTAVTGHDASRQAAWSVARTWHPTLDPAAPDAAPER